MLVLALDSSLAACSAALYDSARGLIRARRWSAMERGHAEALPQMVEDVVTDAETPMAAIEKIAATTGPGSFTGVRIGLAMARGLALSLGIPIVGVTTLRALFLNVVENSAGRPVAALVDAQRAEYYAAVFAADGEELIAPRAVRDQDVLNVLPEASLLVGTGAERLLGSPEAARKGLRRAAAPDLPDSAAIASYAVGLTPGPAPQPLYLRAPYAKLPVAALSPAG